MNDPATLPSPISESVTPASTGAPIGTPLSQRPKRARTPKRAPKGSAKPSAKPADADADANAKIRAAWIDACKRLSNSKLGKWDGTLSKYVKRASGTVPYYPNVPGRFSDADRTLIFQVALESMADAKVRSWSYRGATGFAVSPTFAGRAMAAPERTTSLL